MDLLIQALGEKLEHRVFERVSREVLQRVRDSGRPYACLGAIGTLAFLSEEAVYGCRLFDVQKLCHRVTMRLCRVATFI